MVARSSVHPLLTNYALTNLPFCTQTTLNRFLKYKTSTHWTLKGKQIQRWRWLRSINQGREGHRQDGTLLSVKMRAIHRVNSTMRSPPRLLHFPTIPLLFAIPIYIIHISAWKGLSWAESTSHGNINQIQKSKPLIAVQRKRYWSSEQS